MGVDGVATAIQIQRQLRRLGASADWSREMFTMDPHHVRAVRTAFVRLFEKGLIYRGHRIANWCKDCQTVLSDLEVEYREVQGQLTYVRYPVVDAERTSGLPSPPRDPRRSWATSAWRSIQTIRATRT